MLIGSGTKTLKVSLLLNNRERKQFPNIKDALKYCEKYHYYELKNNEEL